MRGNHLLVPPSFSPVPWFLQPGCSASIRLEAWQSAGADGLPQTGSGVGHLDAPFLSRPFFRLAGVDILDAQFSGPVVITTGS